jgi:Putative auto-transporter adhesin, head GIN domain
MQIKTKTLKSIVILAALIFTIGIANAQDKKGNKNVIKQKRELSGFTAINVGGVFDLQITQGDDFSVCVETDENIQENILTKVVDNVLLLNTKNLKKFTELNVYVTLPALERIEAHGSCDVYSKGMINVEQIEIGTSGASDLDMELNAKKVYVKTSGASDVNLSGQTEFLYVESSGASDFSAKKLIAKVAKVETSGAANATVNATNGLKADKTGSSTINSITNPNLFESTTEKTIIVEDDGAVKVNSSWDENDEHFSFNSMNITVDEKDDSTEIRVGNHKIIIDDDGNVIYSKRWKKKKFNGHWAGLDLGINGYLTSENDMKFGKQYEYLDLNMSKSIKVGVNLLEQNLSLSKNQKWGLVTGLGFEFNNYRFDNNVRVMKGDSAVEGYYNDGINVSKSKLVTTYLNAPLFLEFQTNTHKKTNSFHMAVGMVLSLRLSSHTKQVFDEQNKDYQLLDPVTGDIVLASKSPNNDKAKDKDDFYLNPFKAEASARIGWGWVNLFGTYSLTTMFRQDKGPELYPFSIGLTLTGW